MYIISAEDPETPEAGRLIDLLSDSLASITGDNGRSSFDPNDVRGPRSLFVVARTTSGTPVGCGAFRPIDQNIAEIKRMFAVPGTRGVGSAILKTLEFEAVKRGFMEAWLETRLVNHRAVRFYEIHGYSRIPNYGKYIGRFEAACFAKKLPISSDDFPLNNASM
jgi:GNAT superfamily N-acetyltransferase